MGNEETESLAKEETLDDHREEGVQGNAFAHLEGPLTCVECDQEFEFPPEKREEYQKKGFQAPKRCPSCRQMRRKKNTPRKKGKSKGRSFQEKRDFRDDSPAPANPDPSFLEPNAGSYVAQAEVYRSQKDVSPEAVPPKADPNAPIEKAAGKPKGSPEDTENFGNSIYYQGPGVDPRYGTARQGQPQFAPWEGAHGYLLTHHETGPRNGKESTAKKSQPMRGKNVRSSGKSNRSFQKKPHGNGRKRRPSHSITCMECGLETQVPFKPIAGKPVYCQECYKSKRNSGSTEAPEKDLKTSAPSVPEDTASMSSSIEPSEE